MNVEVLQQGPNGHELRQESWKDVLEKLDTISTQIVFTSALSFLEIPVKLRNEIIKKFHMPSFLFERVYLESNGFCGCDFEFDDNRIVKSYVSWCRFLVKQTFEHLHHKPNFIQQIPNDSANLARPEMLSSSHDPRSISYGWEWYKMSFVCHWKPSGQVTIICFDAPTKAKLSLQSAHPVKASTVSGPYYDFIAILNELLTLYDDSVWSIRNHICNWEANRPQEADYSLLHEIARHGIHVNETLRVAADSVGAICEQHTKFAAVTLGASGPTVWDPTENRIQSLHRSFHGLLQRSEAHNARIQNEITLAFNAAAQRDSNIQVHIGREAKKEAEAMKAIAVVTMTFLPATFVSSIFGMCFFAFEPGRDAMKSSFEVSSYFWVYWVTSIPLTIATLVVWKCWNKRASEN